MIRKTVLMAGVLLIALYAGMAQAAVVRGTAYGNGADGFVANDNQNLDGGSGPNAIHTNTNTTPPGAQSIRVRWTADTRAQLAYLRFDLSGVAGDLSGATLSMTATFLKGGAKTLQVYGLTDDDTDDAWPEATLCYNNAPGLIPNPPTTLGNYAVEPNTLILLGTMTVPAAGTVTLPYVVTSAAEDPNSQLVNFLYRDKNKLVTFVLVDEGNGEEEFAQKENSALPPLQAPTLTLPNANLGLATGPSPADGSTKDIAFSPHKLTWSTSGLTKWDVWFGAADANGLDYTTKLTKVQTGSTVKTWFIPTNPLANNQVYTWVVNGYNGNPTPAEPNVPGVIWRFTATSIPIISPQPVEQIKSPTESAVFTVGATSSVAITSFTWYRSTDNSNLTPGDDVPVPDDVEVLGTTASSTLTLPSVAAADEGYYYCVVSNGGSKASNTARLVVKRQLAYWTFDTDYLDKSTEDPVAQNLTPAGTPVPGIKGNAATISPTNGGYATAGTFNPSGISGQFTLSMWVKWAGPTGAYPAGSYQGVIAKSTNWDTSNMWQLEVQYPNASNVSALQFKRNGGATITMPLMAGSTTNALPVGEWAYLAVTFDGTNATAYRLTGTGTIATGTSATFTLANYPNAAFNVGSTVGDAATAFNGLIDDVQVFNYAKTARGIVDLHNEAQAGNFCVDPYGSTYDYDGSCKVNLPDLATFAAQWLTCGLYPSGC